jgi:hypothetical protein
MSTTTALVAMWLVAGSAGSWDGTWHEPGNIPPMPPYIQAPPIVSRENIAPPPEFNYPFPGKLYISAENTFEQMIIGCGFNPDDIKRGRTIYGCAVVPGTERHGVSFMQIGISQGASECMILLVKRELAEHHYDYDELIRHETAHCNGWRHGIEVADKPAWPRVIDKVADNRTEKPKADVAETPSVEKKPRVAADPRHEKRTAERPAMPQPPWPLVAVSTILSTPFYVVATFARGPR